jgi:hypothetical protein
VGNKSLKWYNLENMKKKFFLLPIIAICILFLIVVTYRRARNWQRDFEELALQEKTKTEWFKTPDINFPPDQGEITLKEFVSDDERLKVDYFSDWEEIQEGELESLSSSILQERVKFIFLARKLDIESSSLSFFMVQEIERENESLSEIIGKMEEAQEEMEIIESEISEEEALIEVRYKRQGQPSFRSKERLILDEEKIYLIAVFVFERDWEKLRAEANKIIASAQLIE